jgi:very-short-patch-repair endonuclease
MERYTFTFENSSGKSVCMELDGDKHQTHDQVLSAFTDFLRGTGFVFDNGLCACLVEADQVFPEDGCA